MKHAAALEIALFLLVGMAMGLSGSPVSLLLLLLVPRKAWAPGLLVLLAAWGYTLFAYQLPAVEALEGTAHIHPERLTKSRHGTLLLGTLKSFDGVRGGKVRVRIVAGDQVPPLHQDYLVRGRLTGQRNYSLKVRRGEPWHPVEGSWSLAGVRFRAKERIRRSLAGRLPQREAQFLSALVTGEMNDSSILFSFSRMGLMHLMAISGFHFSILAGFGALLFRSVLRRRSAALLLILLLTLYLTLVGSAPSMVRAWVMALLFFGGWVVQRPSNALNSLGIALIVCLLFDPLSLLTLGFQFSFACTAAILLFYKPIEGWLRGWMPQFRHADFVRLPLLDQHGALFLSWVRRALAVTLAAHLAALPLTLYAFHRFPWLSLLYNLFLPFWIALLMVLLPVAWLCPPLFRALRPMTGALLELSDALPASFDLFWRVEGVSPWIVMGYGVILALCCRLFAVRLRWTSHPILC